MRKFGLSESDLNYQEATKRGLSGRQETGGTQMWNAMGLGIILFIILPIAFGAIGGFIAFKIVNKLEKIKKS